MLFGWKRVPPALHFIATLLVTIGTTVSAFWIMSANSWMQAPSGYQLIDGKYVVDSWWAVVFNPTFIPRFIHMLLASYVTTCFVIMAVSGFYFLRKQSTAIAKKSLSFSLWASLILVPLQIGVGDVVGINVHHYQPLKQLLWKAYGRLKKERHFCCLLSRHRHSKKIFMKWEYQNWQA